MWRVASWRVAGGLNHSLVDGQRTTVNGLGWDCGETKYSLDKPTETAIRWRTRILYFPGSDSHPYRFDQ